jgi:DNA-binding LacI/PurR family transcriptional regulator
MRTLAEEGRRVPEDVAVVGFDDIEDGRFSVPSLTTIAPDKAEIARMALDCLADRISDPGTPGRELVAGHRLEVRESTSGVATRAPVTEQNPTGSHS